MTPSEPPTIDRLYDLLAMQVIQPLTAEENEELTQLFAKWPHVQPDDLELAAAAVFAATTPPMSMPSDTLARLQRFAEDTVSPPITLRQAPRSATASGRLGWFVAACMLATTVTLGWQLYAISNSKSELTLVEQRNQYLSRGAQRFAATKGDLTGDIVWDATSQRGVMQLRGLKPNVPSQQQYQLWIVDEGRTHKEPVDGGVFDIGVDGTAMVPIKPALLLRRPAAFAITEEPPGGVVVSERGRRGEFVLVMAKK